MKILIVDDDPLLLQSLKIRLEISGYQVHMAENACQALQLIKSSSQKEKIELLMTDLNMQDMDGLELIQAVRKLIPRLPCILMTADGNGDVQREMRHLGGCGYLEKPFGPDGLCRVIREVCG